MADDRSAPKQQRSRDTVDRIVDAAEKLFAEYGVHETQMTQIIESSGVRPGSIYRFFPDKMSIAEAIIARQRPDLDQFAGLLPAAENFDEVLALVDAAVDLVALHWSQNPGYRAVADVMSISDESSPLYEVREAQIDFVVSHISDPLEHIDVGERRRIAGVMAEILAALMASPEFDRDRAARIAEIKRVLRGYAIAALAPERLRDIDG